MKLALTLGIILLWSYKLIIIIICFRCSFPHCAEKGWLWRQLAHRQGEGNWRRVATAARWPGQNSATASRSGTSSDVATKSGRISGTSDERWRCSWHRVDRLCISRVSQSDWTWIKMYNNMSLSLFPTRSGNQGQQNTANANWVQF